MDFNLLDHNELRVFQSERAAFFEMHGVYKQDKIPGIQFGKLQSHSYVVINNYREKMKRGENVL